MGEDGGGDSQRRVELSVRHADREERDVNNAQYHFIIFLAFVCPWNIIYLYDAASPRQCQRDA